MHLVYYFNVNKTYEKYSVKSIHFEVSSSFRSIIKVVGKFKVVMMAIKRNG